MSSLWDDPIAQTVEPVEEIQAENKPSVKNEDSNQSETGLTLSLIHI